MTDRRLQMPIECAQATVKYIQDSQPIENIFYVQKQHKDTGLSDWASAAFDSGMADSLNTGFNTWATTFWAAFAPANCSCVGLDVVWNTAVGTGPLEGRSYSGSPYPIVGTNVAGPLPNSVTVSIGIRTKLLGRSFHGRLYVVGVGKGQVDDSTPNQIKPAEVASLVSMFESLRTSIGDTSPLTYPADQSPIGVMSYVHDGTDRSPAVWTQSDHFALSDTNLDSQRRRLPGHNRHGRRH